LKETLRDVASKLEARNRSLNKGHVHNDSLD
jgi:hypothetical protein